MKKILFIFTLLPLVSFADIGDDLYSDVSFQASRIYYYDNNTTNLKFRSFIPSSHSSLFPVFFTSDIGIEIQLQANSGNFNIIHPSINTNLSSYSIDNSIRVGSSVECVSPRIFSSLNKLYFLSASLVASGYRGSALKSYIFPSPSNRAYINVNPSLLVTDVLSSTNTVFRQILLNHLSSIQTSVANIEVNMSGVISAVEYGNSIVSNIDFNVSSVNSNLVSFSSNAVAGLSSVSRSLNSLENISTSIYSGIDVFNSDFAMNNLDVFLGDDTQTWVDFLNLCQSSGLLSSSDVASYISELQATDQTRTKSYSIPMQHRRFYVKNQIKHTCVEAQKLRGRYQSFDTQFGDIDSPVFRSIHNIAQSQFVYPLSSSFASTIGDWREDLRQQLQEWKNSDERGILNVRDFQNRNFEAPVRPGSTNTVPFYSFITNNVTVPITNSVTESAAGISSNIVEQSETTRKLFEDTLLNPDYPGVNVRIKYPLHGIDADSVHVHDDGLDQVNVALENLTDAMLGLTTGYTPSDALDAISNAVYKIYYFMTTNRNSYLLLDHYSDYISNGVYSASLVTFNEEFPNVYTNLLKYGLSHDNFWTLFGASLLYQSGLVGIVLDDLAFVRDFADSHIEGGFNEGIKKIVSLFPSSSQIEDFLNSASNAVSSIEGSSSNLVVALSSVTNSAVSAFRPFKDGDFSSVPSGDLVFFKLANDEYVTIPVSEQRQVWSLIRTGIAFALIAFNILFFPRFVLLLVLLFSKLSNRFVKFVPTDNM